MTQATTSTAISTARLTLVLSTMTAFGPFATDMYLASFPDIAASLGTTTNVVQLTLSLYLIGLACGQILYGPIMDRFGRRLPLLVGVTVFTLCSLLCAVVTDIHWMIALRLVQALGGCAGMVVGRAVIRDLYSVNESARMLSLLMMVQSLGPITAPLLGSLVLLLAHWRMMFVLMALNGLVCWLFVWRWLPETLAHEARKALSFSTLLDAFKHLLLQRNFMVPALAGSVAMSCMFVFITGSPFVFMQVFDASPQQFGLLFGCITLSMLFSAQLNRIALRRHAPDKIFSYALWVNFASVMVLLLTIQLQSLVAVMIPLWFCIATVPVLAANAGAMAMSASGPYIGSASAVFGLMQFVFASVSSGLLGVFHNGTAYPLAGIMLGVSIAGNLVYSLRVKTQCH